MARKKAEKTKEQNEEKKKAETPKKLSQLEFEKKITELAENNLTSEKIGEVLRKQGIHPKEYPRKISLILKDKKIYINPDLKNVEEKLTRVSSHSAKNKLDKRAMREKERISAQLRRLKAYNNLPVK